MLINHATSNLDLCSCVRCDSGARFLVSRADVINEYVLRDSLSLVYMHLH